jgi:hypothetical protein
LQDTNYAMCNLCQLVVKTEGSNTSGMSRHLKRSHPEISFEPISAREPEPETEDDSFDWPMEPEVSVSEAQVSTLFLVFVCCQKFQYLTSYYLGCIDGQIWHVVTMSGVL